MFGMDTTPTWWLLEQDGIEASYVSHTVYLSNYRGKGSRRVL